MRPSTITVPCKAALALCVALLCSGCTAWILPGPIDRIQPASTTQRVGRIVLLRGFIGVWSFGMDELAAKLKADGYDAEVYQHDQWPWIARQIERTFSNTTNPEPLVIIGHSYGTDDGIRITRKLAEKNIKVNLLVLIDPVTPPPIPANVERTVAYYQTRGWTDNLPWWRGVPVKLAPGSKGSLQNINVASDRQDLLEAHTTHSNIDENANIHREILRMVAETCPLRSSRKSSRH